MLRYLAGSSASVLDNTIVEKEHLASGVYFYIEFRPIVVIHFQLGSVATELLPDVEKRFFEILQATSSKSLDMRFLQDCIQVRYLSLPKSVLQMVQNTLRALKRINHLRFCLP